MSILQLENFKIKHALGGVQCPKCGSVTKHKVISTRHDLAGIRRRRKCKCGAKFSTLEVRA